MQNALLLEEYESQPDSIWVMPGAKLGYPAACPPAVSSCPLDSSQAAYSRSNDAVSGHLLLSATLQAAAKLDLKGRAQEGSMSMWVVMHCQKDTCSWLK